MRWKLNHNPIGLLEQRTWSARLVTWSWFALIFSINSFAVGQVDFFRDDFHLVQGMLAAMLAGSMALTASGSFRRERETGVLELLLVSPLGAGQIISGRLRGIWGQFLPASLVLVGVWLYLKDLARVGEGHGEWIWFYGCTFLTLPVIGLYFSLKRSHFMSALLWTSFVGMGIPLFLIALATRADGEGVSVLVVSWAGGVQLVLAGILGLELYRNLDQRRFAFRRG